MAEEGEPPPCTAAAVPAVGEVVRLCGLTAQQYNGHVGRVTAAPNERGRLAVRLHGHTVWGPHAGGGRAGHGSGGGGPGQGGLSVKPENVRPVRVPAGWAAAPHPLHAGCAPEWALARLLGASGWGLPDQLAQSVAERLRAPPRVRAEEVRVSACSSDRGDFPLSEVLNTEEGTWWITGKVGRGSWSRAGPGSSSRPVQRDACRRGGRGGPGSVPAPAAGRSLMQRASPDALR